MPGTEKRRRGRRRTVCLVSHHPLVLPELSKALSDEAFLVKARRIARSPLGEQRAPPRASLFVVDTRLFRQAEAVIASIADRSEASRIVALSERFTDREAFTLLRLGVKGFVLYDDVEAALPLALEAVGAGGFWAPRALLSRFMDEMAAGARGRRLAGRSAALSGRERAVLKALLENLSNEETADRLHISERTAEFHVSNLLAKFGVRRRQDLIYRCLAARSTSPADSDDAADRARTGPATCPKTELPTSSLFDASASTLSPSSHIQQVRRLENERCQSHARDAPARDRPRRGRR